MSEKRSVQRLGQIRAGKAWLMVRMSFGQNVNAKEYKSLAKSFPGIIHVNGLGQTLAMMVSKYDKKHYKYLGEQVCAWVLERLEGNDMAQFEPPEDMEQQRILALIENIMNNNHIYYRLATKESLSIINVIRKFATGLADRKVEENA